LKVIITDIYDDCQMIFLPVLAFYSMTLFIVEATGAASLHLT